MRIKFVSTYPPTNCGIATYSWHYVDELRKLYDVEVLPIERPKMNPLYFVGLALGARKGADVVHVQFDCGFFGTFGRGRLSLSGMYVPLFYFILKLPGGPRVVTTVHELHDAKKDYAGRWLYWPMRLYYTLVYRPMARFSDAIIAHTGESVGTLSQYAGTGKATVIPHASFIAPTFLGREECKKKLGVPGKRVVTMFGYVSEAKGHDMAIDAMASMPPDVVLHVAGDGRTPEDRDYAASLRERARRSGPGDRVKFLGFVPDGDVPVIMCASDVVLMPYRHVVQSGALHYALAYRLPVLAADLGGFAEVAREYGCILTFRPGDVEDMKAKLSRMLSDAALLESLVAASGRYVRDVDVGAICRRTAEVYKSLALKTGNKKEDR